MIQRLIRTACLASLTISLPLLAQQSPQPADEPSQPPAVRVGSVPSMPAQNGSPTTLNYISKPAGPMDYASYNPFGTPDDNGVGSAYIPLDSWVYPAMLRLYSLGYLDTIYLGIRPYTRLSALHALQNSQADILDDDNPQAVAILNDLLHELSSEVHPISKPRGTVYGVDTTYTRMLGISGLPLNDNFHLGQTIFNDYGRPYQQGFNNITGFSTLAESGRFSLYVRGEYQHAPAAPGYSETLAQQLSSIDGTSICAAGGIPPCTAPPATLPLGSIAGLNPFRLVEAYASFHLLGNEISGGKSDEWLGPAYGSGMAWSNNAEDIYSLHIDRVEPLHIPLLSYFIGPMRYDFMVGSLKGHTSPNNPWIHTFKFSFKPTSNFEFGFQRTVIWGGEGHEPVTLHTFFKSFFDISDTTSAEKYSANDPGARFTSFDMTYRLPFLRNWLTFYTDSEAHDDVTPPSAPRRAAYRPGLYLSHVPGLPKLDLRVEAVSTDPGVSRSVNGSFNYYEAVQKDGYTNKGFLLGDWIGREAKGGQAWLTWHISGSQWVQVSYLNKKTPTNFIPGGTTQNQFRAETMLHLPKEVDLYAWLQYEGWKAPIYQPGLQNNVATAVQLTWHPGLHRIR